MEGVLSKNTNELKTGAPGRFDRHRLMASPSSGACRRRCRRFGFPVRAGKTPFSTRCHAPWRRPGSRPGPHKDQNVLAGYAAVSPGLDSGDPSCGLFSDAARLCQRPAPPLWRKRGTRKSRLETKTENEALSALLARLWCHVILQNRANGAENLTRLCSATIGQTGWRMVQVGAIRSRQKAVQLLAEILKEKSKWRFRRFRVSRIY